MTDFVQQFGDRNTLSSAELMTLDTEVLPKAREWLHRYSDGSNMYGHAVQTLRYWKEIK
jgi:hypothetical protein